MKINNKDKWLHLLISAIMTAIIAVNLSWASTPPSKRYIQMKITIT